MARKIRSPEGLTSRFQTETLPSCHHPCKIFNATVPYHNLPMMFERSPMRFASIRLVTADVHALAGFYENLTGVTPLGFADFMELNVGGTTLAICSERSVVKDNAGAAVAGQNRSAIIEFEVEDVDAERARLSSVVTQWVLEPTDQPWGNRSMLLRDPDGHLVNIFTPPPARPG